MVPPHPLCKQVPSGYRSTEIELPAQGLAGPRTIPNNILVLRVQFSDVVFQSEPVYPDSLVHDAAFFDRWMLHLSDFYADASHYNYTLSYTMYPQVITLPRTMGYYGADSADLDTTDVKGGEFALDIVAQLDPTVNFAQYGGIIVFHAGPGQETDITNPPSATEDIWSTFLTRRRLQRYLDPENNAYPGLATNDGVFLTNIVVMPESEYQDYFPDANADPEGRYLFSMYGVLAHQFGHLLGLPTLFDNDDTNGASQGIGHWGIMGTGVWSGNGFYPVQLDPWCRAYLGWDQPIVVTQSNTDLEVDYFLDQSPSARRLYKIPISDTEYYLVENRQQNPDGSIDSYFFQPSYSFVLLPEGEQDYFENYPLQPEFNFMENRYKGSEWDFFLPGFGGPTPPGQQYNVDGSGLLIWHIDENVITQNFTPNFDLNSVNADASHKGVDIEEADGFQNLDSGVMDTYMYGSPYDTYRAGSYDYFGYGEHNGLTTVPTAESYYGGISLEIYDISASANVMSFAVRFGWSLDAGYVGPNPFPACLVDFDGDGGKELFYPMPNGQLNLWKNEQQAAGYPLQLPLPIAQNYVWDGSDFYLPLQTENLSRLYRLGNDSGQYVFTRPGEIWANQPVDNGDELFLTLNNDTYNSGSLYSLDKANPTEFTTLKVFDYPVVSNMVLFRDQLYINTRMENYSYVIWRYDTGNGDFSHQNLDVPVDSTLVGIFKAPLLPGSQNGEFIVQCANSVYVFTDNMQPVAGFPYVHDLRSTAPLTIADWDSNGILDLIITSDRGVVVLDYSGARMSPQSLDLAASDSLAFSSGALALDLDHDGQNELIGNFGNNQLKVWEQDFRPKRGFPVSRADRSRNLPFLGKSSAGAAYAWMAADNGKIFREPLPDLDLADLDALWFCEYGTLLRPASRDTTGLVNRYQSSKIFVPGEVYIYPNPLKSIYPQQMTLNVMTNRDADFVLRIYDISGSLVHTQKGTVKAYLRNRQPIVIPKDKLSSGVYIAVIAADLESYRIKFAVEK